MRTIKSDILVVGSGFGASAPALRLSEAGFRVLMIEKGKDIVPDRDFKMTQDPKYYLKYFKGTANNNISFSYTEGLGGGSGFYEMVSLRAPSKVFTLSDNNGRNYWPAGIDRHHLDHYYDIAERMLNVKQIAMDEIPKSGVVFSNLMKNLGYTCDRARYAVKECVGSGYCVSGCVFGAKQSLHLNYLPAAKLAGVKIITDTEALCIRCLSPKIKSTKVIKSISAMPFRYVVKCKKSDDSEIFEIETKLLILGGGTIGTAKLLLHSKKNLHFLSSHVGKNIAFNGSVKCVGLIPESMIEGDMFSGRTHPGFISYHFFDSRRITVSSIKVLPLNLVSVARIKIKGENRYPDYWGKANVELMKLYRRRMIILYALGLTPPVAEIKLDASGNVEPKLNIDHQLKSYYHSTRKLLQSIFIRNGCKIIEHTEVKFDGSAKKNISFSTSHMTGSCRMADNKENGVVDAFGEVFDYPGIYVTDGAAIPTSLAVNTSLTILANAERIAHHLVEKFSVNSRNKINNPKEYSSNGH